MCAVLKEYFIIFVKFCGCVFLKSPNFQLQISMAKLHNYHILCPLIDQNSFLGVAQDREKEHVIITLGRNVVNKHRLSDQKQVSGWTSKDHITAPVIFDKNQKSYIGVFNNNTIKIWEEDNVNLDKLKKYKFPINILKLVHRQEQPSLIIFSNGNCASLPYAIENRKTYESKSLLKDSDEIVDVSWFTLHKTDYICFILKTGEGFEIAHCPLRDELGDMDRSKFTRIPITRDNQDVRVVGKFICVQEHPATYSVYVLWSDSKMFTYDFQHRTWKNKGSIPWISTSSNVSMTLMGQEHIIIFGYNQEQDGAIIIAYNFTLGVASYRYPMKMYRDNAKLYCYDAHVILEATNHIGMLPYTIEVNRNLSSLLGTHDIVQSETPSIADWGTPTEPQFKCIPELEKSYQLGITERSACIQVIPALIDNNDTEGLMNVLKECKDVPESSLAVLVSFAVKSHIPDNDDDDSVDCPLLNEIFNVLFCDALLIPHLRNNLTVTDSLNLMKYILYHLFISEMPLETDYESRLYDWLALILDAFYQQFVMSKEPEVERILKSMSRYIHLLVKDLCAVSDYIAQLHKLVSSKGDVGQNDLPYAIEIMQI